MATVNDWNAYINVVHELALIEDDLRWQVECGEDNSAWLALTILRQRF